MDFEKIPPRRLDRLDGFVCLITACFLSVLLFQSCTIAPHSIDASQPSFSGNVQNSGIISSVPSGGFIVDQSVRDRFAALVPRYGGAFDLDPDPSKIFPMDGGVWYMDRQRMVEYDVMCQLSRMNAPEQKPKVKP